MNTGNISIKASVSGNTPGLKGEKGNGIKSTVLNDDYSLTFNYTNGTSDTTPPIRGQKGEKGDNGISPSITTSKSGKVTTITIKDATGTKVATINDGVDSQGDMLKSTYDKNSNGIVDNSEKVNGHTVESNVPANAKFTDTIYTHPINSGNKHIPSGGSSGQILKWEEDGAAKWDDSIEAHREGTELKVNNYKQLIKFTKEGKTEQKTYTGKNLFSSKLEVGGIDTTTGLNATNNIRKRTKDFISIQPNTTYTFSYKSQGDYAKWGWYILYDNNQQIVSSYSFENDYDVTFTSSNDAYYFKMYFGNVENVDVNSFDCQLEEGTVATEFEPYVGGTQSPNPNYPQKIKNVRGIENLFKPTLATTVLNGITCAANRDGTYTLNGTATADTTFTIGTDKNLIIDKTYKFLGCPNGGSNTTYRMSWNFHGYEYGNGLISKKTSEARNVQITIFKGITASNLIFKPMFTEDTLSTYNDYVPFGSNYLQLENKTENLIGLDNKQYRVNLKKGDKIFAVNNGTTNLNLNLYTNYGDITRNDFFTIAANSQRLIVIANNSHAIAWGGTLDNNAWVVKGEKFIPYEQYQEKIINVDLKGNELCSDKEQTLKDELLVENGKAKIIKKYDEVVLNGTENFGKTEEGFVLVTNDWGNKNKSATLSNYFTTYTNYSEFKEAKEGAGFLYENVNNFYIKIDGATTVNEFRAKLKSLYNAGTPVIIQYPLAEPKVIELGEVDFDLIENSTLTCEEESDMQIDYLTIDSNIFVQDSLDGNSSQKAPSINAVNEIISKLEARIIALENKNV